MGPEVAVELEIEEFEDVVLFVVLVESKWCWIAQRPKMHLPCLRRPELYVVESKKCVILIEVILYVRSMGFVPISNRYTSSQTHSKCHSDNYSSDQCPEGSSRQTTSFFLALLLPYSQDTQAHHSLFSIICHDFFPNLGVHDLFSVGFRCQFQSRMTMRCSPFSRSLLRRHFQSREDSIVTSATGVISAHRTGIAWTIAHVFAANWQYSVYTMATSERPSP
jgi:hypothetical protein